MARTITRSRAASLAATTLALSLAGGGSHAQRLPWRLLSPPPGTVNWSGTGHEPKREDLAQFQQKADPAVRACATSAMPGAPPDRFLALIRVEVAFLPSGDVTWTSMDFSSGETERCITAALRQTMHVSHTSSHPVLVAFPLVGTTW